MATIVTTVRGTLESHLFAQLFNAIALPPPVLSSPQGYSKSSFLRDETASFTLNACETGYLYSVEVKIVPNDNDPNWNLEEVRVQVGVGIRGRECAEWANTIQLGAGIRCGDRECACKWEQGWEAGTVTGGGSREQGQGP